MMRQRFTTFAVLGLILVLLSEWHLRTGRIAPLTDLDHSWLEFCVGNAGDKITDPAVTVIRIDDDYEPLNIGGGEASEDGALSRLDFATILGFIAKQKPSSVAFFPTPSFDESLLLNQTDIVPLKDAAMQLPKLSVATSVTAETSDKPDRKLPYPSIQVEGDPSSILAFERTLRFPEPQLLANGNPAFKAIESAQDLITETSVRIPLVARYGEKVTPSVVLTAVAHHAGISMDQITVDLSRSRPQIRLGDQRTIPIQEDGTLIIPSHAGIRFPMSSRITSESGDRKEVYHLTSLTVDELAYTGEEEDEVAKRILADFQGKFESVGSNLVLVGFDRESDRRFVFPDGSTASETLLLTRAVATIQSGRFITQWPTVLRWFSLLVIVGIALVLFRYRKRKFIPIWFITALAYFSIEVLIFRATLSWSSPFASFALFGVILLVGLLISGDSDQGDAAASED
ncbi:MAG: hypothetical protein AAGA96_05450 [Verrucomicrobiota bacterium]